MKSYGIGLDIGVASVGWAALALDETDTPYGILGMGSRIFDAAEHPKNGESLATPRRNARGNRRRLRRHRHRLERIRYLLVSSGVVTQIELDELFLGKLSDIYQLRVDALDRPITNKEFARILIHIAQRRGFRSNRKGNASAEDGKLLTAVNTNLQKMEDNGYRTVAEMLLLDEAFSANKRNKGGEYITTVSRDMIENEVKAVFASQRGYMSAFASEDIENAYLNILLSQRSFDEGPALPSPYSGNQIENMVGHCTFFPEERRAAKATYSFEYFVLLEKLNHIRILTNGQSRRLTTDEIKMIADIQHQYASVNYSKIRKLLCLDESSLFNTVTYDDSKTIDECEKKAKLSHLKAYHEIKKAIGDISFSDLTTEQINTIGSVLTLYKSEEKIHSSLLEAGIPEDIIDLTDHIGNFSGFGHISVKACELLIPHLEKGMNYNEACEAAGINFKAHNNEKRTMFIHPTDETYENITSPVVKRSVAQSIKVLNAIIREQGCSPTYVNIELARELSKDFSERKSIEKENLQNQAENERIISLLRSEFGIKNPTGMDLVKYRLFAEQGERCAYSLEALSIQRLFEPGYAEIDHIIPYSISFDDSRKNKVLVLAKENRDKGNRLPLQYLTGKKRDDFIVWVNSQIKDSKKRRNLLKERITEEDETRFKERSLQDTKTASRFLYNLINDTLIFAPSAKNRKKRVTAVNGAVTAHLRKRWGINKIRGNGDLHHAVDAVVLACTTDRMIQQISRYSAWREVQYVVGEDMSNAIDPYTGEIVTEFPYPWYKFRYELEGWLSRNPEVFLHDMNITTYRMGELIAPDSPLTVSRVPKRKVTGAAHKDTVKGVYKDKPGYVTVKKPLTELKLKNGEIVDYPEENKISDKLLYDALVERLAAFGGDGKKAFDGVEFRKPKSDGTPGPVVKKVKLLEKSTLNVPVHGGKGRADNDSLVRLDIFKVENDGYYFVPIYVADTLKETLPSKACVAAKPYDEWKEMRDEDFLFSVYPNDMLFIAHKNKLKLKKAHKESNLPETIEVKEGLFCYKTCNISTGAITCINNDNSYILDGIGIKTLLSIEKYTVSVLGKVTKVSKEKRMPFDFKKRG